MTVNRTTLLDLPLPVTGTESGTWGDTTNNGLTQYMDIAIAGMSNLTSANFTTGALTIETTEGDSTATNISATSAQYAGFRVTSLAQNSTITVGNTGTSPARSYRLINADATYTLTFKATGQTGITLQPGQTAVVAFNGTDYVIVGMVGAGTATDNAIARFDGTTGEIVQNSVVTIADSTGDISGVGQLNATTVDATNLEVTNIKAKDGTAAATIADSTGVVTVTAAPVMTALTASQAVFTTAGKALTSNAITGTGNVVMSASPTLTGTISAAAATLSGNLTLSGGTANGVLYLDGSKVATSGSALTFNGSSLTQTANSSELYLAGGSSAAQGGFLAISRGGTNKIFIGTASNVIGGGSNTSDDLALVATADTRFFASNTEQMRLTSTGLGIGTSSPLAKLHVKGATNGNLLVRGGASAASGLTGTALSSINDAASATVSLTFEGSDFYFVENNAVVATLNSSGNLGLGVTPSAWGRPAIQGGAGGTVFYYAATSVAVLSANMFFESSTNKYIASGYATQYSQSSGAHAWFTAPSGTAGNAISFTQAMTLDASGNLGLGTTSPKNNAGYATLTLNNATNGGVVQFTQADTTIGQLFFDGNGGTLRSVSNTALVFGTNGSERARITSGGDLLVGTTSGYSGRRLDVRGSNGDFLATLDNSNATPFGWQVLYSAAAPNNTTSTFIIGQDSTTLRFEVRSNGGIANYSANDVNLSDRREKTNFAPAGEYLSKICAIPVQTFNYIDQSEDDPGLTLGVVAQDVQAVAPELVMESNWGSKDDPKMRLSIYQTDLQYALMKCIQEQQALIESLTTRVALLEGA